MSSSSKNSSQSKSNNVMSSQQPTLFFLDLKAILQAQEFHYNNLGPLAIPDIFVAMTPYMVGKLAKYHKSCFFVMLPKSIQGEHGTKDSALLLTLNSNLQPSILGFGIFKSQYVSSSQALEHILKFTNQKIEIDNMTLYCNQPESIQEAVQMYNSLYSKHIEIQPSFLYKQTLMKEILVNSKISKKPYLKKQAFQTIQHNLEQKDQKKFTKQLQKFKQWNQYGYNKFYNEPRKFRLVYELPQNFFGFGLLRKYDGLIQAFIKKFQRQKFKNQLELINYIIEQEYKQMQLKRTACVDPCSIFQNNSRVKQLIQYIQPNPLNQFLENYQKSLSFKYKKINENKYIIGGKVGSAYQVTNNESKQWVCQCGQTQRLGIPCQHLLKVCCIQKLSFQDQIDGTYRIGHQKPFLRLD